MPIPAPTLKARSASAEYSTCRFPVHITPRALGLWSLLAICLLPASGAGFARRGKAAIPPLASGFANSRATHARLSPNGHWLAIAGYFRDARQEGLALLNLRMPRYDQRLHLVRESRINHLRWAGSRTLLVTTRVKLPGYRRTLRSGEIWAIHLIHHRAQSHLLAGYRKHRLEVNVAIYLILSPFDHDPDRMVVERYSSADLAPEAEILNVRTGHLLRGIHSPMTNGQLLPDNDGHVRLAFGTNALTGRTELWFREPHTLEWKNLSFLLEGSGPASGIRPLGFLPGNRRFYLLRASHYGTLGLYDVNPGTRKETRLYVDPSNDIRRIARAPSGRIYAVWVGVRKPHWVVIAPKNPEAEWLRLLAPVFRNQRINILSVDHNHSTVLVRVRGDRNPGEYYLFNPKRHLLRYLMSVQPEIAPPALSRWHAFLVPWHRLQEPVYLAFPHRAVSARKGLVVWIHGHPFREGMRWRFDPRLQELTRHGFVVMEVDYPGSFGRGRGWRRLGYRQWGGAMLKGVWAAVRWAARQHRIPDGKLALAGHGYGGYAALMLGAEHPKRVRAIVSLDGIYRLPSLKSPADRLWRTPFGRWFLETVLGRHHLESESPLAHAQSVRAPVFLVEGGRDSLDPSSGEDRFVSILRKHSIPVQVMEEPTQGWHFTGPQTRTRIWRSIVAFLDRTLMPVYPPVHAPAQRD